MKKIILYVKNGLNYKVNKFENLGEGHNAFNQVRMQNKFDYIELGIDDIDQNGKYLIVRKIYCK